MIVYKRKRNSGQKSIFLKHLKLPGPVRARLAIQIGIWIVVFLLLFILVNSVIMPIVTRHNSEFPLTYIEGMTVTDAEPVLLEGDLKLQITSEEYHPDKPTGTILSQFPVGGTMVKAGRTIKVVTSLGQKAVPVPDLHGFSVR